MNNYSITLRGYRPNQVDEYVARLQRVMARLESDLRQARAQSSAVTMPPPPRAAAVRPALPEPGEAMFTERMEGILRAAEEEAAEIRQSARDAARTAYTRARSEVAELVRQRDAVLSELTMLRRQIEGMFPAAASAHDVEATRTAAPQPRPGGPA